MTSKSRKRARRGQQRTTRPNPKKQGAIPRGKRAGNSGTKPRRRRNWAAIGAVAAVLTALFAGVATIASHLTAQADQRQIALAEMERCDKLLEQAAHNIGDQTSVEIRLAGIHQLDSLSVECREHHPKVLKQLASYVRRHSPVARCEDPGYRVPDDVEEAVVVLGNRIIEPETTANEYSVDLSSTCLRNLDLSSMNFTRANFAGADLSRTKLSGTKFQGAYFLSAKLERATMLYSDFTCAVVPNVQLTKSFLVGTRFVGADLVYSNLTDAVTAGADFRNANLSGTLISEAQLSDAVVQDGPPKAYCMPPDNYPPVLI